MKKNMLFFWSLLVLPFLLMGCAAASVPGADGQAFTISDVQMYIIGALASGVLYGLKFLAKRFPQWTIKRDWLTVLLYVVALGLSVIWSGFVFPAFAAFSDPLTFVAAFFGWVNAMLIALAPPVSFATLIYNVLLKRVFDGWAGKS